MGKYGVNKDTVEIGGGKFIQVDRLTCIATGRYLDEVETGKTDDGVPFLQISVRENDGKTAQRRYFEPRIDGEYINNEKDLEKAENKFNALVANLMRIFYGDNYDTGEVDSFETYVKKIESDVKRSPGWNKREMRVKLVLNPKDYPTIPSYAPVFEDAKIPLAESKLKIGPYDRIEKAEVKADEDREPTPEEVENQKDVF